MRRLIAILLAITLIALPIPASASKLSDQASAIQPLQWQDEDGTWRNHCTAWATRIGDTQIWVTAGHCIVKDVNGVWEPDLEKHFRIGGKDAILHADNLEMDVAELLGGPSVSKPLPIALKNAQIADPIHAIGYPFGWEKSMYTQGVVSNDAYVLPGDNSGIPYAIYNLAGAPGMSGSPVLSKDGAVVGIIQITLCVGFWQGFCPMVGGLTTPNLRLFLTGHEEPA